VLPHIETGTAQRLGEDEFDEKAYEKAYIYLAHLELRFTEISVK
jgi:hypothetical protein